LDHALQSRRRPADRRIVRAHRHLRRRSQPPHRGRRALLPRPALALVGGAARGAPEHSTAALQGGSGQAITKRNQRQQGEETMAEATDKIAVVTGAGTGVGRAASLALMSAGFTVVLAGRRKEMLEETQKLGDNVGKSLPVVTDVSKPESIAALFQKVQDTYGRL